MCATVTTGAEVEVSVTLTGDVDELIVVLKTLQQMGVGVEAKTEDPLDELRLQMHSFLEPEEVAEETSAPEAEPEAPAEPVLGFTEVKLEPAKAAPGQLVLVTATVSDPGKVVDTVALSLGDSQEFDLFDNGQGGDETALDGVWSRKMEVPYNKAAGDFIVTVTAYDVNGDPISAPGATETDSALPMKVDTVLSITE
jgi:hypothetical protein